jgi:hypothetical protein
MAASTYTAAPHRVTVQISTTSVDANSLRSSPITEPSSLLRTTPPLCPASVLWSSRILPLGLLPLHRDDRFSRSIQEPDPTSRRLNAGCRAGSPPGSLPCLSRKKRPPPVSASVKAFRHFIDGSLALASPDHTCRNLVPAFLQRSPRSLLTTAACSGLRPAPDCRPRGAYPHLSYSTTPPYSVDVFVTHDASCP